MPAATPFLHPCGVLGAEADALGHIAGDADVAADTFADVVDAAFVDPALSRTCTQGIA
jgi:hypothetical protein